MKKATLLSIVAALFAAFSVSAEISLPSASFEASLGQKYEENLLRDWTQISDYTSTGHAAVKLYFTPALELNASIDRSWIRLKESTEPRMDTSITNFGLDTNIVPGVDLDELLKGLSTITTGLHATFIPTVANSRLSVYFTGGVGRHSYDGETFQIYNTTDYDILGGVGYQYSPRVHLRSEVAYNYNDYTNAEYLNDMVNSKQSIDLVGGANWSISGTNVLDLEVGLSEQNINATFIDTAYGVDNPPVIDTIITDGMRDKVTRTIYLSPRFSRQLGERTGVTLTYTYRNFVSGSDIIVAGEAASLLDPFATVWEGSGVTLAIKTFLIPRLITTFGLGYWDKTYLRHLKGFKDEPWWPSYDYRPADRSDEKSSIYFGFQMPLPKTWAGLSIEPVLSGEYSDNSSTIDQYDTFDWNVSLGVSLRR